MSKKEDQIWEKVFIQQGYGDKERYPGIKA